MRSEIIRLRGQAEKARRLAVLASDPMTIAELNGYADECESNAENLEADTRRAQDQTSRS